MTVEVKVQTLPHFKVLISGIEDLGHGRCFYLMIFHLKNSHFTTKKGLFKTETITTVYVIPRMSTL